MRARANIPAGIAAGGAFTLMEVILALTLAVGLVGAVLAFHDRAVDIRGMIIEEVEAASSERIIMDRVTSELRNALTYPFLNIGMDGQADQMRFIAAVVPSQAVWAVRGATDNPAPPEHDLELVGYRLRTWQDDDGVVHIDGLERTCQKILTAQTAEEGVEITASLLTGRIKFLRLQYWDGSAWAQTWNSGDLPLAVEICMGTEPLPEGTEPADYPYSVFRRVVYVPGGTGAVSGTVVRGLEGGAGP